MRQVFLEIPEPDATGYQNLMRQNPKLTRSDATRSTLRPKCPQSAERPLARAARKTGEEIRCRGACSLIQIWMKNGLLLDSPSPSQNSDVQNSARSVRRVTQRFYVNSLEVRHTMGFLAA